MSLLKAIVLLLRVAIKYIDGESEKTELSLIMSRLSVSAVIYLYIYDLCFQPRLSRQHLQSNIIGQALPVMKSGVSHSAIVRNSESSGENWSPYRGAGVKQEAIPQL